MEIHWGSRQGPSQSVCETKTFTNTGIHRSSGRYGHSGEENNQGQTWMCQENHIESEQSL